MTFKALAIISKANLNNITSPIKIKIIQFSIKVAVLEVLLKVISPALSMIHKINRYLIAPLYMYHFQVLIMDSANHRLGS